MYNIKSIKSTELIYTIAANYALAYIKYHKTARKIKICTFSCLNKSIINIELEAQNFLMFYTPN